MCFLALILHNIILNSIPKSGTSLIGNIFEIIGYKYAGASLTPHNALGNTIKAILRNPLPGDKAANLSFEATSLVSHNYVKRVLKKGKQPNYVSAHMAYCPVIELILKDLNFKHILLIRNPKDVILSYCFYLSACLWIPCLRSFCLCLLCCRRHQSSVSTRFMWGLSFLCAWL